MEQNPPDTHLAIAPLRLLAALALALAALPAASQPAVRCLGAPGSAAAAAAQALTDLGLEAVGVCVVGDEAAVTYENRVFRYDVRAMDEVLRATAPTFPGVNRIRLLPTRNGVPLIGASASTGSGSAPGLDGAALAATLDPGPLPAPVASPSRLTLDLVLHPHLEFDFGDFDNPVRADAGVAPAAHVHLRDGLSLTGQVIVPFAEETSQGPRGVRPSIITVRQEVRLPLSTFARVDAGLFTRERYGLDVASTTFVASGRAALALRAGRTGFAALDGGSWLYSRPNLTTYSARLDGVLVPQYGLGAGVTLGRYLSGASGVRVDVYRSFGESAVGVFALTSEGTANVGGSLSIPLPVRRHPRPGRVRARLADAFEIEYRYRRVPGEARDYEVSPEPWAPLSSLNPTLLPYRIRRYSPDEGRP